jgi:putative restriction endonuclease
MKIYVGVTDYDWFNLLKERQPEDVNFWQPNSNRTFHALQEGELFLFKLHSPRNFIVGGGIFTRQVTLPLSLTWDAFGINNGVASINEFRNRIDRYRNRDQQMHADPVISSLILTRPFFLDERQWIPVPQSWAPNIVSGKTYDVESEEGRQLYQAMQSRLPINKYEGEAVDRYGRPMLITPRLGQGSFRLIVTEAYHRRCAVTGEKTLPVLDAAHIMPFAQSGQHSITNGILLRQDMHTLFDRGYITIHPDRTVEVSRRIKEDFGNGKEYYAYHGQKLIVLPDRINEQPSRDMLAWHNEHVFVG